MIIGKEEIIDLVHQLPDEVDIEELIYRLYLREKLAVAEADIAAGCTLSPRRYGNRPLNGSSDIGATHPR